MEKIMTRRGLIIEIAKLIRSHATRSSGSCFIGIEDGSITIGSDTIKPTGQGNDLHSIIDDAIKESALDCNKQVCHGGVIVFVFKKPTRSFQHLQILLKRHAKFELGVKDIVARRLGASSYGINYLSMDEDRSRDAVRFIKSNRKRGDKVNVNFVSLDGNLSKGAKITIETPLGKVKAEKVVTA